MQQPYHQQTGMRRELLASISVLFFYLLLRLPGLLALPLFNDEAVYLRRAQQFPLQLIQNPFDSGTLPDGKLLQELALAILTHVPGDPLLPARLFSVACGLGTLVALQLCGRQLGYERAGMLAGLLYALAPLAAIHDRLAIPDSMLTMVGTFLLMASIRYARGSTASRRGALGIGALVAAAALVKLSGLLLAATPVLAVLILGAPDQRRWRLGQLRLSLIVALAALAMLAPFHYGGAERQKVGSEASRIILTMQNVEQIGNWLLRYLPGPLLILPLAGLAGSRRQDPDNPQETSDERRAISFLLMTGLALPSAFAVVGGSLVSRYILPAWPALLLAAALGAQLLWQQGAWRIAARGLVGLGLGTAVLWGGFFGLSYSTDPRSAPLDSYDRWQYTQSWTAGYAMSPLISHVQQIAATSGPIRLVIQDQTRLASLASQIYLSQNPQIELVSINLISANAPQQLHTLTAQGPTYLLADEQVVTAYKLQLRFPGLTPIQQLQNPDEKMSFWLFIQLP